MYRSGWSNQRENPPERRSPERMEAGLREEQPTPPPADSPQRHNSALSNAGCSSGAGASDVGGPRVSPELQRKADIARKFFVPVPCDHLPDADDRW